MIDISVLTPVRNCASYLRKTIDSVIGQSKADFEYIIADNGSSDGSLEIAEHAACLDRRISVLSLPGESLPSIRNKLVNASRGKFLCWIDADDIAAYDRLARQFEYLSGNPSVAIVGSDVQVIDPDGLFIRKEHRKCEHQEILDDIINHRSNGIFFPASMVSRKHLDLAGGFSEAFPVAEDLDLYLRLSDVGRLANIEECLTKYRWRLDNLSWTRTGMQERYVCGLLNAARVSRGLPGDLIPFEGAKDGRPIWWTHAVWSRCALNALEFHAARRHALLAISRNPLVAEAWEDLALSQFPLAEDSLRTRAQHFLVSLIRRGMFTWARACRAVFPGFQL